MFVWLSFSQTLGEVIAGCEAAGLLRRRLRGVVIPDNLWARSSARPTPCRRASTDAFREYSQARGFVIDPARVAHPDGQATGWSRPSSSSGSRSSPARTSPVSRRDSRALSGGVSPSPACASTAPPRRALRRYSRGRGGRSAALPVPYDVPVFTRPRSTGPTRRDRQALYSAPRGTWAGRTSAPTRPGQAVLARAVGQGAPAAAAGRAVHRPRGSARGADHLRDARCRHLAAAARRRGTRSGCTPTGCWTPTALDADAAGLPAARLGPPVRCGSGRGRVRTGPGGGRGQRQPDRPDAGARHRERAASRTRRHRPRPVRP